MRTIFDITIDFVKSHGSYLFDNNTKSKFLDCFSLLKSKEMLQVQDDIWKKICEHLKWEFIPSFDD